MEGNTQLYYMAAEGEKVYFQADENKFLLYVQGRDALGIAPKLLSSEGLEAGEPVVPPGQTVRSDDIALVISLSASGKDRSESLARLHNLVEKQFPNAGLAGRLAAPMFRDENIVEGLTNELIVRFEPKVTEQEAQEIAHNYGFTVLRRIFYLGNAYLWQHADLPHYGLLDIARELKDKFPVRYAEPNIMFQIELDAYDPNDFLYPEQPHFQVIHADEAWDRLDDVNVNLRAGSPDIAIAVFDGHGVHPSHPDLTGILTDGTPKMLANYDFLNWTDQTDGNLQGDHGTKCASSAAGRFDSLVGGAGLAGNCHLIGAMLPANCSGADMADAWLWAAGFDPRPDDDNFPQQLAQGADVISNSWGVPYGALTNAIRDALDFLTTQGRGGKGCVVCFSVGNLGYTQFSNVRTYAAYDRTIAVGASINANPTNPCTSSSPDPGGNTNNLPAVVDTRAYYSPYGPEMDLVGPSHTSYALGGSKVDPIVAAVRVDQGTWTGEAVSLTATSAAANAGSTVVDVNSTAGFMAGEYALIGTPGAAAREFVRINAVGAGQLTCDALQNAYPVGTPISTGPNDYDRTFGGTSHSCPTVAGAAALILSVRPGLTWEEVRDILRTTAERIDPGQANATGQWVDNDGDGVAEFSQWYGYGRLDVDAAIEKALDEDISPHLVDPHMFERFFGMEELACAIREFWCVACYLVINWHIRELKEFEQLQVPTRLYKEVAKHVYNYVYKDVMPPEPIAQTIINAGDKFVRGQRVTFGAGDYIALENYRRLIEKAGEVERGG